MFETTASHVKIRWDFEREEDPFSVIKDVTVQYRSDDVIEKPAMLVSNPNQIYYVAQEAGNYRITPDVGRSGRSAIWTEIHPTFMLITVDQLKLPFSNYRFDLSRTLFGSNVTRTSRPIPVTETTSLEVVRSKVNVNSPDYPVKTGDGCFNVIEHNKQTRKVKIYWQPVRDVGKLVVYVYELDPGRNPILVHEEGISSSQGWITTTISLKLHYVVIEALSKTGSLSSAFSTLYISRQEELLPALSRNITWNEKENITVMTWKKPENLSVYSYTVFWLDPRVPPLYRIYDFVHLSSDKREFKVKGNVYTFLGLSVNTKTASSGLRSSCSD